MISNAHQPPPDAASPTAAGATPAATPVPANIAALLYVVAKLLEYGRHLVATMERRAASPGFWLFAAVFGTASLRVILAHLHRGILRAAALETLLLTRAATGRDVQPSAPRPASSATAAVDPLYEPLRPQFARLLAERARSDAPIDPDHLPTPAQIEAEVRNRPIGRTVAAICRDLGIVPGMCTREFWDALMEAIACYEGSAVQYWQEMHRRSEAIQQAALDDPELQRLEQHAALYPHQTLGFKLGERPVDPFRDLPQPTQPRDDVPLSQEHAAAPPEATGPPPPPAMPLAA